MEFVKTLETFLDDVRKKRAGAQALNGIYLTIMVLIGTYTAVNLTAYFFSHAQYLVWAFAFLCVFPLAGIFYRYFIRGAFSRFSLDQAALLVEAKHPGLNNALINSSQLRHHLDDPAEDRRLSLDFIRELIQRTIPLIQNIPTDSIVDRSELARNRNLFLGVSGLLVILMLAIPDFLARGYHNLLSEPQEKQSPTAPIAHPAAAPQPLPPPPVYLVKNMTLTYNYPAYTQLKSLVTSKASGDINVLPGTEVQVLATLDNPVGNASLTINEKDEFAMTLVDEKRVQGQFLVDQEGSYRFKIKAPDGQTAHMPTQYPITLTRDQAPKIVLFVANFKPIFRADEKIELRYESRDDYGIHHIDLITEANGKTGRTTIKTLKTPARTAKDSYIWHLSDFNSGDQVKFYLEVLDNDNVSGPNSGQSEAYSFSIYDLQDEQDNLIRLQDELIEKMISLLAQNLVGNENLFTREPDAAVIKRFMTHSADAVMTLISMAQNIYNNAGNLPGFPESHITLLKNIAFGLTQLRGDQIEVLKSINATLMQASPLGADFPPAQDVTQKLIGHLEQDLLFLIKTNNSQKMGQIDHLKEDLNELAESIKKELKRNREGKNDNARLKSQIKKMKQLLKKMMDQFARQTQPSADEFLNPNAFKSLDLEQMSKALDEIMKLADQQNIDEAQKELQKLSDSLKTLSKQIDKTMLEKQTLLDKDILKKIDDSLRNVLEMEKKQGEILDTTAKINEAIKKAQSKSLEDALKQFFQELGRLVGEIQTILHENEDFMDKHMAMRRFNELAALESKAGEMVQQLGQKALDSATSGEIKFKELNEARARLAEIAAEKDALRVGAIQQFKNHLPKIIEHYKNLKDQTELLDFTEFNRQFKNLYPDVLRLQNDIQVTPNTHEELADRARSDLQKTSKLNSEISKKLGSMMRSLEKEYQSLMTRQNQEELERMAKQESQMQKEAEDLAQQFIKMNQQNPMISPDLAGKMDETGRHMKSAEGFMNRHEIRGSLESENHALKSLAETRDILKDLKNSGNATDQKAQQESLKLGTGRAQDQKTGGGIRNQSEKVELPSQDQFQAPSEFREELLKAMKNKYPRNYEQFVNEYYKELVK